MGKENNCRKRIILMEAGRKIFWKYGIKRVTVGEICKEAGVSKMTFYRCFGNKIELAKNVYTSVVNNATEKVLDLIYSDISTAEKMKGIIEIKLEGVENISRDFITDFHNSQDTELQRFFEETNRKSYEKIIKSFHYAQEKGWFRNNFKPEFLFYFAEKIGPLIADEYLLKLFGSPQNLIMEITNLFTYGIAPEE
jgi:AcrR family transcriptional regulator